MARKIRYKDKEEEPLYISYSEATETYIHEKMSDGYTERYIKLLHFNFNLFMREIAELEEDTNILNVDKELVYRWRSLQVERKLKPNTINGRLANIRALLNWCSENKLYGKIIYPNGDRVAKSIKDVVFKEERDKIYTEEDLVNLLRKPSMEESFMYWRTWALINYCFATGQRIGTARLVKLKDVDLERREVFLTPMKNGKVAIAPMSAELHKILKEYIELWLYDESEDTYLFPTNNSNRAATYNGLYHGLEYYCERRGIQKEGFHALRRNFAKGYIRNNGNPLVLQRLLNHSTLQMTNKYVKLYGEDLKEGYDLINPLDSLVRKKKIEKEETRKRKEKK